jgi:hypothetical protein
MFVFFGWTNKTVTVKFSSANNLRLAGLIGNAYKVARDADCSESSCQQGPRTIKPGKMHRKEYKQIFYLNNKYT